MRTHILLSPCLMLCLAAAAAAAPEKIELADMKQDMAKVAKKLIEIVEGENQAALAIGQFASRAPGANFGPGMEEMIRLALNSEQPGCVQPKAELTISGSYTIVEEPRLGVQMTIEVFNRRNERIKEFVAELTSNADIAKVAGVTASLPPEGTKKERNEVIKKQFETPQVFFDGSLVCATADSSLAVELRSKPVDAPGPYMPRIPTLEDGCAYAPINRGDVYEIMLYNRGDREVAAAVTIDGLSCFCFSEDRHPKTGQPLYSYYIVGPHQTATVPGWYLRTQGPDNYASFLVTEYGKGASARMPRPSQGSTGVITVAYSYTSPIGSGRAGSETGMGPPRTIEVRPTERAIDPPHEFVTVRYDK